MAAIAKNRLAPWIPAAAVLAGVGWGSNQFTPMLLVYHQRLGLSTGTLEAMFGVYALGLIPGLLVGGPLSDARGRRAVVVPAAAVSLLATVAVMAGAHTPALLFVGRLLVGVSSGAVLGAGTAWVRELSASAPGGATRATAVRRAAVAMTFGFAFGPLVAGLLAQWVPAPTVLAYVPHVALMTAVLALLSDVPETVPSGSARGLRLAAPGIASASFRRVVAPMAPWVFVAPVVAFALLPSVVGAQRAADGIALTAAITALTALSGVLIQPLARRLEAGAGHNVAGVAGLLVMTAGMVLAAVAAQEDRTWMLVPCGVVFGSAYGLCLVAGLSEVQRIADENAVAGLTAAFYALTYLGFAVPYLLALAAHLTSYTVLFLVTGGLALATAAATSVAPSGEGSPACGSVAIADDD